MLDVPVAFCTFNRPDVTAQTFARIRQARPTQLFLISDAARSDRPEETELVQQTRDIVENVDWHCDVIKIYADSNLGCGPRISSGITEAFRYTDRLIILEDDCLPHTSFFDYCQCLLSRYEDENSVSAITGNNFQNGIKRSESSYYFSKYMHCWGWATWRRAWRDYSYDMENWPAFRDSGSLVTWCENKRELEYWTDVFDRCHRKELETWDYPWLFSCWFWGGLCAVPEVNLVSNIGFGDAATHTTKSSPLENLPTESIHPIKHPKGLVRNVEADRYTDARLFSRAGRVSWFKKLRRKLGVRRPRAA